MQCRVMKWTGDRQLKIAIAMQLALVLSALAKPDFELEPLLYTATKDDNTITRLQRAIDAKKFVISGTKPTEVLDALLDELNIPVASQVLVFSKTSLQRDIITPGNPRAIYFNRDFYVGYVPGGLIEIIACDDPNGMMFYSFNVNEPVEKRRFLRDQECMTCHATSHTMNIPGLLVRSVFTKQDGLPVLSRGSKLTTPASPIEQRWGGWYVTGSHGDSRHMGNNWIVESDTGAEIYDAAHGQNVSDLSNFFDTGKHLTDSSDILALMIMEHQIQLHNTLSAAKMGWLRSLYMDKAIHRDKRSPSLQRLKLGYVDSILRALLFADEVKLPEDGIDGSDAYKKSFLGQGIYHDGHSLRDLRLEKRIFKYRCSFMIHSESFQQLPHEIKTPVLEKLHAIVTSEDEVEGFPHLSSREKERIHDILAHTHPGYQHVMNN